MQKISGWNTKWLIRIAIPQFAGIIKTSSKCFFHHTVWCHRSLFRGQHDPCFSEKQASLGIFFGFLTSYSINGFLCFLGRKISSSENDKRIIKTPQTYGRTLAPTKLSDNLWIIWLDSPPIITSHLPPHISLKPLHITQQETSLYSQFWIVIDQYSWNI
jgi:hypothetical protein